MTIRIEATMQLDPAIAPARELDSLFDYEDEHDDEDDLTRSATRDAQHETRNTYPEYLACTSPKVKKRKQALIIRRLTGNKTASIFTDFPGPLPGEGADFSH